MPNFAHVSLILALDRIKLSKQHGVTSVGQFREMGYLSQAMVNYLALLGWGDGTENEFYTLQQLVEKLTIGRVNMSGAIFDSTKLRRRKDRSITTKIVLPPYMKLSSRRSPNPIYKSCETWGGEGVRIWTRKEEQ